MSAEREASVKRNVRFARELLRQASLATGFPKQALSHGALLQLSTALKSFICPLVLSSSSLSLHKSLVEINDSLHRTSLESTSSGDPSNSAIVAELQHLLGDVDSWYLRLTALCISLDFSRDEWRRLTAEMRDASRVGRDLIVSTSMLESPYYSGPHWTELEAPDLLEAVEKLASFIDGHELTQSEY